MSEGVPYIPRTQLPETNVTEEQFVSEAEPVAHRNELIARAVHNEIAPPFHFDAAFLSTLRVMHLLGSQYGSSSSR